MEMEEVLGNLRSCDGFCGEYSAWDTHYIMGNNASDFKDGGSY